MNIAICEDTSRDVKDLTYILQKYEQSNNTFMKVDIFTNGEDLISQSINKTYDVIFMDIYLPNMTGIEIAKQIRKLQKCHIVFFSASSDYALDAIALDALHYIVKPITYSDIEEIMIRLGQRISSVTYAPIEVKTKYQKSYINPLKIHYIESYDKVTVIHTDIQDYETYTTLSTFAALLDKELFMQPQRSYIVNMEYINFIYKNTVVLADNTHITLSRANHNKLKKSYENFIFKQIREGKK